MSFNVGVKLCLSLNIAERRLFIFLLSFGAGVRFIWKRFLHFFFPFRVYIALFLVIILHVNMIFQNRDGYTGSGHNLSLLDCFYLFIGRNEIWI